MQKEYEKRWSIWTVWSYEKEEQWVNVQSKQGLHLEKAHLFTPTFRRDPSVRYTYRLDYQPDLTKREQLQEYLDLYADAGWEHTATIMGWQYFRRPWAPGEEPVLYSDRSSLRQQYQRIQRLLVVLLSVNLVTGIVNLANLGRATAGGLRSSIALLLTLQGVVLLFLAYGTLVIGRKIRAITPQ